ncbi:tape measure protein [Methylovulum psychrotolerans]|uniref:Tape measure protein N-terminal domain-containing protein n=1 Tax=Methylovulum psychrotolerans TaxID=1704499 RepID=A0A2S5CGI0_9GAMM|nr:tape measure protein [Methylovulum psychrotolerans]POZ49906.1 hypothetical protein AADEFJLK_04352 [Methylovulum psychrotolerans]
MATNLDLTLRLRANADGSLSVIPQTTRNINQLSAASDQASRSAANSQRSFSQLATQTLDLGGAARAAVAGFSAFAIFNAGKEIIGVADAVKLAESRIIASTKSTGDFVFANKALLDISMQTHTEMGANQQLFSRTNAAVEQMGGSIKNTLAFNDMLAKSLKLSGAAQSEANSVIRQTSQALASGVLRGDEFNSIMENGFVVAHALADGLGVSVGALRKMAEAGELTADKVFTALLSQAPKIDEEFSKIPVTVAGAFTNVETQFGQYVNATNNAHRATSNLASGIDTVAHNLPAILDVLVLVGEAATLNLASKGVGALQAFVVGQHQSRIASQLAAAAIAQQTAVEQAHTEALAINSQATLSNLQSQELSTQAARQAAAAQIALAESEINAAQATIASTSMMLGSTTAINNRVAAQIALAESEQRRTVLIAEQTALDTRQTAITAELTAAQTALATATADLAAMQEAQALTSQAGRDAMIASAQIAKSNTDAQLLAAEATQVSIIALRPQAAASLAAAEADIARAQATIAATAAAVQNSAVLHLRTQAEYELVFAEQERTAVTAEIAALDAQQAILSAEVTAAQTAQATAVRQLAAAQEANAVASAAQRASMMALLSPMNLLNVAFAGIMGYQIGSWMSGWTPIANTATAVVGGFARAFEDVSYWAAKTKAAFTDWGSLDALTEAHKKSTQAILDNVHSTFEYRQAQDAAIAITSNYKDIKLSTKSAEQIFNEEMRKSVDLLNLYEKTNHQAGLSTEEFTKHLGDLRDAYDRAMPAQDAYLKKMAEIQKATDKANLSPLEFDKKQINDDPRFSTESAKDKLDAGIAKAKANLDAARESLKTYKRDLSELPDIAGSATKSALLDEEKLKREQQALESYNSTVAKLNNEYNQAVSNNANLIAATEAQNQAEERRKAADAAASEAKKADKKDEKEGIKLLEAAHKSAYEVQIKGIEQVAQAQLALNALNAKQLEFDYQQNNIGLQSYLAEREKLIRQATETEVAALEKQKQAAMAAVHTFQPTEFKIDGQENTALFESLLDKFDNDLQKAKAAYMQAHSDLTVIPREQIRTSKEVVDINDKINQVYRNQEVALTDLNRTAITETQAYTRTIDELNVKYLEVTGSARAAFLARQELDSRDGLKRANADKTKPDTAMVGLINKTNNAALLKRDTEAAITYQEKLNEINRSTRDIGLTSTQSFDLINQGIGGLSNAFDSFIKSLHSANDAIADNALAAKKAALDSSLEQSERDNLAKAYAQKSISLEREKTLAGLTGIRQLTGATANMFGENTAARQAFSKVEQGLAAVELVLQAQKLFGIGAVAAAETASIIPSVTASTVKGEAKAAEAVATQATAGPYIGFVLMAAMAAAMAAIGFATGALGSSIAQPPASSPDTGTVLGDSTAQSESIGNIVSTLKDIHASEYPELRGINTGITDLQAALSGTITTLFQAGGLDTSNVGLNLGKKSVTGIGDFFSPKILTLFEPQNFTKLLDAVSGIALIDAIFSGGYTSVVERGIQTTSQTFSQIIDGAMLKAQQYNVIKIRSWDLFSDSTSYETAFNSLNSRVERSLTAVYSSAGQVAISLAQNLGGNLEQQVRDYVMPPLKIDLTGLSGDDAAKKLNAVLSTALDTMATDVFGSVVGKYQHLGEGMLETASRIVAEVAVVQQSLSTSGMSMAGDAVAISDALVQAAGGLQDFQTNFSDYYDKFFSDAEKQSSRQANLTAQLQGVFLGLPDTRAGYRALVEALDLSNAKDRERYTLLLQLSSAADSYYSSLESSLKTYQDAVKTAYDTASSLLQQQVTTYQGFVDSLKSFEKTLVNNKAAPADQYATAKADFYALRKTLATGTDAQKETALGQLQNVTQTYLDASKNYNASGLGYIKDFADAQALLTQQIGYSQGKADVAKSQLDALTSQLTALGVLNKSVLTVKDAVDALAIAMTDWQKAKAAQEQVAADNANKAAFLGQESARRATYDTPIAKKAAAYGAAAQQQENRLGWSDNASRSAFSAEAIIKANSGAVVGGETYQSSSRQSGQVIAGLRDSNFASVRAQFGDIGHLLEGILGGVLPDVFVKIAGGGGNGTESYTFNSQTRTLNSDDIDPLVRMFAKDAVSYLADGLDNKAWADQVKAVSFSSIAGGFNSLSTLMDHLKHPYTAKTYDPLKKYAMGGVSHTAAIFGEAGPEAAVPLPDGRSIPVTLFNQQPATVSVSVGMPDWIQALVNGPGPSGADVNQDLDTLAELKAAVAELRKLGDLLIEQNKHAAANVRTDQAGFLKVAEKLEKQVEAIERGNRAKRVETMK